MSEITRSLTNVFSRGIARRKRDLNVVSARECVEIEHLAYKIQSAHRLALHSLGVYLLNVDAARSYYPRFYRHKRIDGKRKSFKQANEIFAHISGYRIDFHLGRNAAFLYYIRNKRFRQEIGQRIFILPVYILRKIGKYALIERFGVERRL